MQNKLILRNEHSPYNDITQGSVLSTGQLDGNLIFLKGLAINSAVSSPSTITLKRINGEEIVIPYSGNTGSGTTINQNNKFIFIDLGYFMLGGRGVNIDESNVEQYISPIIQNRLNNINLTVREDELIIFKCKFTIYGSFNEYRYKFYFPNNLGKGIYNPLGNTITYNMLEIAYKELNVITTNSLTNSPNVNIINLGEIPTNDYLDYINNNGDQYDFTDTNKIHYFRFTYNNVDKIYVFDPNQSLNGYSIYGLGLSQFSNGDLVLFYDSSIVLPNPNINYFSKTKAEMDVLISDNALVKGATYEIVDVDPDLYGGTSIYLTALQNNKLSLEGSGKFYTPKYEQVGTDIWSKYMQPIFINKVGLFNYGEIVNGAIGGVDTTAAYICDDLLEYISGDWSVETSILGVDNGGTAEFLNPIIPPNYNSNTIVHWGGKSWSNIDGNLGESIDQFNLNNEWLFLPFNEINYNVNIDVIKFDYENNKIIYRKDKLGNEIETSLSYENNLGTTVIKNFKFGDEKMLNNKIIYSNLNNINNSGFIRNNILKNSDFINNILLNTSIFEKNQFYNSGCYNNCLISGAIINNNLDTSEITNNNLYSDSYIDFNTLTISSVGANRLTNSTIRYNTLINSSINGSTMESSSIVQNRFSIGALSIEKMNNSSFNVNKINNGGVNFLGEYINKANTRTEYNCSLNLNLTTSTILFSNNTDKKVYQRQDNTARISYYGNSDTLIINDVTT